MAKETYEFHWADYLVFCLSLLLSLGIGFFFACRGRKKNDTTEFLMGGNSMNPVAVGLSIAASLLNAVFLIGVPSEVYFYGTIYSLIGVAWTITSVIAAHVFIPFFRNTKYISCYEYLGDRFNSLAVRLVASLTFALSILLFMAVVLYAPALAFEAVTGLSIHLTQILCGLVCTMYVVMGGLKAVVWTDAVQMAIVMIGTLIIAIVGANEVGGGAEVWKICEEDNRVNFDTTSADPTVRHTVWTQLIGQVFIWLPVYGSNQMAIQRYYAVSSTLKAQISMYVSMFTVWIILAMVTMCGLVMYANFRDCDPFVIDKAVDEPDQLFPLLLMRLLGDYHGLPGLYVAAVFAAALSSVSSAVNSLAAVVLEDFIKPIYCHVKEVKAMDEKKAMMISRGLSLGFGLATIALSYVAPLLGDELIQIPTTIWGVVGAPLFGVFVMAIFFPSANAVGAITGLLLSLTFSLWLAIGGILHGRDPEVIMPIGLCLDDSAEDAADDVTSAAVTWFTTAEEAAPAAAATTEKPHDLEDFYSVSYAWYGLINTVMCVLVGLCVSWAYDGIYYLIKKQKPEREELRSDQVFDCGTICCCMPQKFIDCLRCGVNHDYEKDLDEKKDNKELQERGVEPEDTKNKPASTRANQVSPAETSSQA